MQARQAKARKEQIKEERERKAKEEKFIRQAKRRALNGPPGAGKSQKFNAKAVEKGYKREAKKAAQAAAKKAERKAKGFWG